MPLSKWMQKNQWKVIAGKKYRFHGAGMTKAEATKRANVKRKQGFAARVVNFTKDGRDYATYIRIPKNKKNLYY